MKYMNRLETLLDGKKAYLIVIAFFLVVSLARFYNIALHITTIVPGSDADTYGNLWEMWWVGHSLFALHASMLSTKLIFWPVGANLIYQTLTPAAALLSVPLQAISMPFAYDTLFFLGFVISGTCMFALADYVLGNRYAALIAGVIFAFSATHITHSYTYMDWMFWGWVPLSLYFFLRIMREKRSYYNAIGLAFSFALAVFMGNVEEGMLVAILCAFVLVAYALNPDTRKQILKMGTLVQLLVSVAIVLAISSWYVVPLARQLSVKTTSSQISPGLLAVANQFNNVNYNIANSMDFLSFFLPSFYRGIGSNSFLDSYYLKIFSIASIEKTGYLTYIAIALAIIGIVWAKRKTVLWVGIFILFAWFSTGPYLQFYGNKTRIPGPYLLYHAIPFINIIREPGRFILVAIMALSILAAYGFMALDEKLRRRVHNRGMTYLLIAVVLAVFFTETMGTPITNSAALTPLTTKPTIPSFYYSLKNTTYNFSIMQLPAIPSTNGQSYLYSAQAEYYASVSGKPLVGGYITRTNYTEYAYMYYMPLAIEAKNLQDFGEPIYLSPVLENYTNQTLLALYNFNTAFIIVNDNAYNSTDLSYLYAELVGIFGNPIYSVNATTAFSTSDAIQKSVFRSFVAYPVLSDWNYTFVNSYGLKTGIWSPRGNGLIAVFAPYPKGPYSQNTSIANGANYTVNATLSFFAASPVSGAQLQVGEQAGTGSPTTLGTINLTPEPVEYKVRISDLASGDLGNYVMFVPKIGTGGAYSQNANENIYVYNVTISLAR